MTRHRRCGREVVRSPCRPARLHETPPLTSGFDRASQIGARRRRNHGRGNGQQRIEGRQPGRRRKRPPAPRTHAFASALPRYGAKAPVRQRWPATGRSTNNDVDPRLFAGLRPRCLPRLEGRSRNDETSLSADVSGPARRARCRQRPGRSFDEREFEPVVICADRRGRRVPTVASGSMLTPGEALGDHLLPAAAAAASLRTRRPPAGP